MRRNGKSNCSVKVRSNYQITVPKEVREHLQLEISDKLLCELLPDNTVVVRKSSPLDLDYLQALSSTMDEWLSNEDEEAYKDL